MLKGGTISNDGTLDIYSFYNGEISEIGGNGTINDFREELMVSRKTNRFFIPEVRSGFGNQTSLSVWNIYLRYKKVFIHGQQNFGVGEKVF